MYKNILLAACVVSMSVVAGCATQSVATNTVNYQTMLTGKTLRMDGSTCAGISLGQPAGILVEKSATPCVIHLPTRVTWTSPDTFMLVQTVPTGNPHPPRVYVYKVKSQKGDQVVLTEFWVGWGNHPDEEIVFTVE